MSLSSLFREARSTAKRVYGVCLVMSCVDAGGRQFNHLKKQLTRVLLPMVRIIGPHSTIALLARGTPLSSLRSKMSRNKKR